MSASVDDALKQYPSGGMVSGQYAVATPELWAQRVTQVWPDFDAEGDPGVTRVPYSGRFSGRCPKAVSPSGVT